MLRAAARNETNPLWAICNSRLPIKVEGVGLFADVCRMLVFVYCAFAHTSEFAAITGASAAIALP
jgi:hypothetical protein